MRVICGVIHRPHPQPQRSHELAAANARWPARSTSAAAPRRACNSRSTPRAWAAGISTSTPAIATPLAHAMTGSSATPMRGPVWDRRSMLAAVSAGGPARRRRGVRARPSAPARSSSRSASVAPTTAPRAGCRSRAAPTIATAARYASPASIADVTEHRQVEEQLRQAQKMEAIGQLTGGIAHDFNNLLMVIGGNLDMLDERIGTSDRTSRYLAAARHGVERGAKLNQQLLAFSRRQDLRDGGDLHRRPGAARSRTCSTARLARR